MELLKRINPSDPVTDKEKLRIIEGPDGPEYYLRLTETDVLKSVDSDATGLLQAERESRKKVEASMKDQNAALAKSLMEARELLHKAHHELTTHEGLFCTDRPDQARLMNAACTWQLNSGTLIFLIGKALPPRPSPQSGGGNGFLDRDEVIDAAEIDQPESKVPTAEQTPIEDRPYPAVRPAGVTRSPSERARSIGGAVVGKYVDFAYEITKLADYLEGYGVRVDRVRGNGGLKTPGDGFYAAVVKRMETMSEQWERKKSEASRLRSERDTLQKTVNALRTKIDKAPNLRPELEAVRQHKDDLRALVVKPMVQGMATSAEGPNVTGPKIVQGGCGPRPRPNFVGRAGPQFMDLAEFLEMLDGLGR